MQILSQLTKLAQHITLTKRTTNDQQISEAEKDKYQNKFVLNKLEDELEELIRRKHNFDIKLENTYNENSIYQKQLSKNQHLTRI